MRDDFVTGTLWPAIVAVAMLILPASCGNAVKRASMTDALPKTISGFSSPKSIAVTADGKRIFVSNMGAQSNPSAPSAKNNDGFISELTPGGAIVNMKLLPKEGYLNSPGGMTIINGILYVIDVDRLIGFDINTRETIFETDFSYEKTAFLNDLAVREDQGEYTLFMSATDIGKVYELFLNQDGIPTRYFETAAGIAGPSGLYYDKPTDKLYVVSLGDGTNGELGVIGFRKNKAGYKALTGPLGSLDGLARFDDDNLIFLNMGSFDKPGALSAFNLKTLILNPRPLTITVDASGATDFIYSRERSVIWMLKTLEGTVTLSAVR
ncbi:MAG: hypothetical protein HY886_02895 [Deltaproteobacteria bacterium]|nr:hypothetical protein [Deltaproteobacteria bacterium]